MNTVYIPVYEWIPVLFITILGGMGYSIQEYYKQSFKHTDLDLNYRFSFKNFILRTLIGMTTGIITYFLIYDIKKFIDLSAVTKLGIAGAVAYGGTDLYRRIINIIIGVKKK